MCSRTYVEHWCPFVVRQLAPVLLAALIMSTIAATVLSTERSAFAEPLQLRSKIPLGSVKGRVDHMAIDPTRKRLLIAELGNEQFAVRKKATEQLQSLGDLARPLLEQSLKDESDPEVHRRVERLLDGMERAVVGQALDRRDLVAVGLDG